MAVERAALGRIASIGDLYDIRQDTFPLKSSFTENVTQEFLTITDCPSVDTKIASVFTYSDKLSGLDANVELQVSVLLNLLELQESLKDILDDKPTEVVESFLTYRLQTKTEILNIDPKDVMKFISRENIEGTVATHVVTGITWGAKLILSVSSEVTNDQDPQKLKEDVDATMKAVATLISGTDVDDLKEQLNKAGSFQVKIYCDTLETSEKCPSSLPETIEYIKGLPSIVEASTNGKGQPLIYHLTPLNELGDCWNLPQNDKNSYKELNNDTYHQIIKLFEQLHCIQKTLNRYHQDSKNLWYCLTEKDKEIMETFLDETKVHELNLKQNLSSVLLNIRSGKSDVTELEIMIKKFKGIFSQANDFLDQQETLFEKFNFAPQLVSNGGKYIGLGASLDQEIASNFDHKAIVLYFTNLTKDVQRWKKNKQLFLKKLQKKKPNTRYFAVDCDIHPTLMPTGNNNSSCIQVLQSGRVIKEDYLEDYSKIQITPRARVFGKIEKTTKPPRKHIPLSIPCAGILCDSQKIHNWKCTKCGKLFQYGFDHNVYCACGKSLAICLEFKCPDTNHGIEFQRHSNITQLLEKLQPPEEINILILGETGVGKSTWINGFINYLNYGSIQEAQSGELLTLIPSEFTVCNPTPNGFEEIVVRTGQDNNEVFNSGQSATQTTKFYPIPIGNTIVRLIDTPGIGDTRGIEQDKKNFQNILTTLSQLDEIHGICILLKPNSARLTVMFRFCIKELLTYLHRDASKNIVFCFTNSRSTLYKPGDTFPALNALLKENKEVEIVVRPNTVYCYDSEAYRFLAAMQNDPPVYFDDSEKENFAKSWERSIIETERMLKYIKSLKPHPIRDTINLNHAREMVLKLTRPLAEISRNIQTNKANLNDELDEIEKTEENISKLKKNKFTTITEIQSQPVDHPKTVCAHSNCVKVWKIGNVKTNEYVKVCHEKCQLKDVQRDSLGDPGLMKCAALYKTGGQRCCICGHDYKIHLHVYYDSIQVPKRVEDQAVKEALKNNLSAKEMKEKMISSRKRKIEKFEEEQKQIEKASAKFAYFLRKNAITPYNDEMEQYLHHLIREEKDKVFQGGSKKALECLESSMSSYLEEKRILETEMGKDGGEGEGLTPKEVDELVEKLKGLELTGTSLREALECVEKTRLVVYREEISNANIQILRKTRENRGLWESSKSKVKKFLGYWIA